MTLLLVLILLSLIATIIALVIGLAVMSQGGELDMQLSNKLMQARVWLQGLTVFCYSSLFLCCNRFPRGGCHIKIIATIDEPAVIDKILVYRLTHSTSTALFPSCFYAPTELLAKPASQLDRLLRR